MFCTLSLLHQILCYSLLSLSEAFCVTYCNIQGYYDDLYSPTVTGPHDLIPGLSPNFDFLFPLQIYIPPSASYFLLHHTLFFFIALVTDWHCIIF